MRTILNRAVDALRIILDIVWISIMAALILIATGFIAGMVAKVIAFGYNLVPL